jgi:3-hydroxyacyl-CoA dehydrogenase / enoyl-CoA hydratase / 3-hydroxybutyryl-CoA epimerase / enoyl-CoA isomerase
VGGGGVGGVLNRHRLDKETPDQGECVDRLFLPMLLEAVRVLDEEIVRDPAHVDIGVILGIGFPAFRGGILHWCDSEGAGSILDRLTRYESLGPWFRPPATLLRMARTGGAFFPVPTAAPRSEEFLQPAV